MRKAVTCFAVFSILLAMMSVSFAATVQSEIDLENGVIRVKSLAAGKATEQNPGVRRGQAKRAAISNAQLELFERVKNIRFDADNSVGDLLTNSEVAAAEMNYAIKSLSEVSEKFFDDDTCEVVIELPIFGQKNSVLAAAFAPYKADEKISFPQPSGKIISAGNYTGLIVDCRGLDLQTALSPAIQNNRGKLIYSRQNLDFEKILAQGMVSYSNSITDARAGNNPLVVKAVKISGAVNPVVTNRDANKILRANQAAHFLDNCAIVFVR